VDHDVADEPPRAGDADRIEEADSWQGLGVVRTVLVAKELVAAADGEQGRAVFDRGAKRLTLRPPQIAGDGGLLLVLAAAPEEEIDVGRDRLTDADLAHFGRDAPPPGATAERDDVAPVAIDVHLRSEERR